MEKSENEFSDLWAIRIIWLIIEPQSYANIRTGVHIIHQKNFMRMT